MRFLKKFTGNFGFTGLLLLVLNILSGSAVAQETPAWDRAALRDSAETLIAKYQDLHNRLGARADLSDQREFVHLFSNPKVQVVNDLNGTKKAGRISLDEYMARLSELYPDGLAVRMEVSGLVPSRPVYDRNNRYIFQVKVNRTISGINEGRVVSATRKNIISIAFLLTGGQPGNFTIYGIDLPEGVQGSLTGSVAPALTGITNRTIREDSRFGIIQLEGYRAGLKHTVYFSRHAGFGFGASFTHYGSILTLDKFDAFGGFDPNLRDVRIDNRLWCAEFPLYLAFRGNAGKRFEIHADAGLAASVRIFETMTSSAINAVNGNTLQQVFTDVGWIVAMNRFGLGIQGDLEVVYHLSGSFGILAGIGLYRGLTDLDHTTANDYASGKYQGQYNPLWGAPGTTSTQAFYASIGAVIQLYGAKSK